MIAELFTQGYDVQGRPTFRPDQRRRGRFPSTFPMGRYFAHSLAIHCESLEDLRKFLKTCRGVADKDQFGKDDYWMPPEDFEESRKGDCDDFAMYAWRQLSEMGYRARFVAGTIGDSREGHAWVTFEKDSRYFLLEPTARDLGLRYPRLDALRYTPFVSVEWDGKKAHFFRHEKRKFVPPFLQMPALVLEWVLYHMRHILLLGYWLTLGLSKLAYRKLLQPMKRQFHRP